MASVLSHNHAVGSPILGTISMRDRVTWNNQIRAFQSRYLPRGSPSYRVTFPSSDGGFSPAKSRFLAAAAPGSDYGHGFLSERPKGKPNAPEVDREPLPLPLDPESEPEPDLKALQLAEQLLREKEEQRIELEALREREKALQRILEEKEAKVRQLEVERKKAELEKQKTLYKVNGLTFFVDPDTVSSGTEIDLYFQYSSSHIFGLDKGSAWVKGAFNDWIWKPFDLKLEPDVGSSGVADWWKGTLKVPEEAFRIVFVFHNDVDEYDNNGGIDYEVSVEGGMEVGAFERMLAERVRAEAEKEAAIAAEKERVAEEERRQAEERRKDEEDRIRAKETVSSLRDAAQQALNRVSGAGGGDAWFLELKSKGRTGGEAVFGYNRSWKPLWQSSEVFAHVGYNNWSKGVEAIVRLGKSNIDKEGDWWTAKIAIPDNTFLLNWVLADGHPGEASVYDNNDGQDYLAAVGNHSAQVAAMAAFYAALETDILQRNRRERRLRQEAQEALVRRRAEAKLALREKTKKAFLKAQEHILYSDPVEVTAGETVKIYYNPSNTVLSGAPEVWLRGSFNRWTHRNGLFAPQKMQPVDNSTHLLAQVSIPYDAYCMDFVFSDTGSDHGGLYDNKGGLDYHMPVLGGLVKPPPLYVVHIALEMAPIAKVGGLGDVVTSLSRAVQEVGHNVEIVLPKYDCINYSQVHNLEQRQSIEWGGTTIRSWHGQVEGISVHFLEPENGMFWVGCIYGRKDDGARFGFFCNAALEFLNQTSRRPDIIHCHDWSSAPTAWLFAEQYKHYGLGNARTVFTIHNLEFGQALIGRAMATCDKATTVSPTYAQEVSGHSAVSPHLGKFHGILNGIDFDIWDPLADPHIPLAYDASDVVAGKAAAKRELRTRLGLRDEDRPLVGIVSRLTAQKGIHLIKAAIWRTLDRGGQVVLLGSAPDGRIQADFQGLAGQLAQTHGDMARLCLSYDEPLSHLIYAASDMILVPSIFEPCGLTQMIAMRYGAVPVVRKTGGLNDTVFDVDHDVERARAAGTEVNGFSFEGSDNAGVDYAVNRAISAWYEARDWWNDLAKRVMEQDWSWNKPALDYIELYYGARKY